jgi:hypothetical protein
MESTLSMMGSLVLEFMEEGLIITESPSLTTTTSRFSKTLTLL